MAELRGIRLHVQLQDHYAASAVDGFRFTIVATDGVLMPDEIFRYLPAPNGLSAIFTTSPSGPQGPQDANTTEVTGLGQFDGVCSPPDLVEFPTGEPVTDMVPPYFRLSLIDLLFRSREEAVQALADIEADVNRLIRSMNANDQLGGQQQVWISATPSGDPDDTYYWN